MVDFSGGARGACRQLFSGRLKNEAERLYREYVSGLRHNEHKAFIAPTYSATGEAVRLLIYSAQPENATVSVTGSTGNLMSRRSVALLKCGWRRMRSRKLQACTTLRLSTPMGAGKR